MWVEMMMMMMMILDGCLFDGRVFIVFGIWIDWYSNKERVRG